MQSDPVLNANGIVAAISAVVAALIAFGVIDWTDDQRAAFMAAVVAVLGVAGPLAAAWWARRQVTPLADPKVTTPEGKTVALVRADNQQPTPQAMRSARIKWERGG